MYLRRNEHLLKQRREQLVKRNVELRAELGAKGVRAPVGVVLSCRMEESLKGQSEEIYDVPALAPRTQEQVANRKAQVASSK